MLEQVPSRGYLALAVVGLATSLVATAVVAASSTTYPPEDYVLADIEITPNIAPNEMEPTVANAATSDELSDASVQVVIHFDGKSYVALGEVDETNTPKHGKLHRAKEDYVEGVVASVRASEVPAWSGRTMMVDGSCRVTLSEFAVLSRLTGDPGYAGLDGTTWTSAQIFEQGHRVLVARFEPCVGTTGLLARDVAAPRLTMFENVVDDAHAAEARGRVLASQLAADTTAEWERAKLTEKWTDTTELATMIVRDPRDGTTWISVHAHVGAGCGDPDVNIWGLFRVEPDGSLATVQLRHLDTLTSITKLVDVDGDGVPELIGETWIGPSTVVVDADGAEIVRADVPFFGCPC